MICDPRGRSLRLAFRIRTLQRKLYRKWLKVPVKKRDEKGNRHLTEGKGSTCGTQQGGVTMPA
jgi:CO dehydrogenase nickel-insertion accessory protein CooC1